MCEAACVITYTCWCVIWFLHDTWQISIGFWIVIANSLFLFTHCSLSHCVFSLTLSIFLFSFACSHSRNSSRLHQSSILLARTSLFSGASLPHPFGTSLLQPIFTGWMAFLFISSSFPSFLPFTLFISSHNKCKPLTLTLLQLKSLSSALIGRMALLVSFLSSFPRVSQV